MILITGSAGYIGSHLTTKFDRKKIDYIGIDNLKCSYKGNITDFKKNFFIDIDNERKINSLIKKYNVNTVIHAAALSYVLEAENKKKKYYLNNIKKTKKFINICKKNNVKEFIFLSSSNVYKEKKNKSNFKEEDLTVPKNFYGKNKLEIEKFLKKKNFKKLIILRLFNIIGLFNKNFTAYKFNGFNYQRLIFKLLQSIKNKKKINIHYIKSKNKYIYPSRDFIDVKELSIIIIKILKIINKRSNISKIFNVGSGKDVPINKIINLLKVKFKKRLKIDYLNISNKELLYAKANIIKIKNFLRYKPKINLKKTLMTHYDKF